MTAVAGGILGHDDLELPVAASGKLQESLQGARPPDGHDDFIGVDVLNCLFAGGG